MRKVLLVIVLALALAAAGGAYWWHSQQSQDTATYQTPEEASDVYVRFDMEGYDIIKAHYWQTTSDADLSQLFQLSLAKAANASSEELATSTRSATASMLEGAFKRLSGDDAKRALALQVLQVALYNLAPAGRSGVLSNEAQTQLKNTVDNVRPSNDPYALLGVASSSSAAEVTDAYDKKSSALAATTSESGKAALTQIQHAYQTLTNPVNKQIYESSQGQPTVFTHRINAETLYIDISQVAPTTIQEISAALDTASTSPAITNLIIDERGNIGGDLGFAQEFLSLFYGPGQYAFDLFHQGNLDVQRTGGAELSPTVAQFHDIAIITDNMSQSTAELVASAMKHDHLAVVVGQTSRGWGSVEQVLPMQTVIDPSQQYAIEMVVYLSVRYDGKPIEGNGVVPDIDTAKSGWQQTLPRYFSSSAMVQALSQVAGKPPLQ